MTHPSVEEVLAQGREATLAVVKLDGHPHLSNVFYTWDRAARVVRIASTVERLKVRVLRRDPRAALHVAGEHFWAYAVAEGRAEISEVVAEPEDPAGEALLAHYRKLFGVPDRETFFARMLDERRLLIELRIDRVYGMVRDDPRTDFHAPPDA